MNSLFTLGYEKRSLDEFIELLCRARIDVLIDVRETAWSHKPGFSKSALQSNLAAAGIEYVHARFAGNPKHLRSAAATHADCLASYERHLGQNPEILSEFAELVTGLQQDGRRVCIACFERHPDDCHRGILASKLKALRRARIQHLAPTGCPRLAPA